MDEHHRSALLVAEVTDRLDQFWRDALHVNMNAVTDDLDRSRSDLARRCLPDAVEIAHWVGHLFHPVPVLPGPTQRIDRSGPSVCHAERRRESNPQPLLRGA